MPEHIVKVTNDQLKILARVGSVVGLEQSESLAWSKYVHYNAAEKRIEACTNTCMRFEAANLGTLDFCVSPKDIPRAKGAANEVKDVRVAWPDGMVYGGSTGTSVMEFLRAEPRKKLDRHFPPVTQLRILKTFLASLPEKRTKKAILANVVVLSTTVHDDGRGIILAHNGHGALLGGVMPVALPKGFGGLTGYGYTLDPALAATVDQAPEQAPDQAPEQAPEQAPLPVAPAAPLPVAPPPPPMPGLPPMPPLPTL